MLMEAYEQNILSAAEHNSRMMAQGDRTIESNNIEDMRGFAREMRFRAESALYELQAAMELAENKDTRKHIEKAMHLMSTAKDHAGCAINEAELPGFRRRAFEIRELGERLSELLGEISPLAQI